MYGPSFTSKGTKYFHQFNISLCGGQVRAEAAAKLSSRSNVFLLFLFFSLQDHMAVCTDNVTDLSVGDSQRGEGASAIKTFICQSTIIPASGRSFHTALSSQSINLADTFLGSEPLTR